MESTTEQKPNNGFEAFRLYWQGKGKLSTAYWGFGVVGSFVISLLAMFGILFIVPSALRNGGSVWESTAFRVYLAVVYLILLGYQIVVWILIWRNAHNTSKPIWSQLAKMVVAFSAVLFLYQALKQI